MIKRIQIPAGKIGLVFRKSAYKKCITEGIHWVSTFDTVFEYDMTKPFTPSTELNILLRDEALAEKVLVASVADNEIALQFENGYFKNILTPGRYAYWKGVYEYSFISVDLNSIEIPDTINPSLLQRRELLNYLRVYSIEPHEKGLLYINAKFNKPLDTGLYLFWKNNTPISVLKADLRQQQMEISGQEILTKDKAALRINFFTQYRVTDIVKALHENKEYDKQLYVLLQLALREYIGTQTLDELLERREAVSDIILQNIQLKAQNLGVEICDCGIRDIILPGEMKEIMNQVLIAQKKAQANIITRREETASTRSLLNTAKLLEENEMLYKLKEMEYVEKIADKINSITLSGGTQIVDQLKSIFVTK